jgi:hypothetical protein
MTREELPDAAIGHLGKEPRVTTGRGLSLPEGIRGLNFSYASAGKGTAFYLPSAIPRQKESFRSHQSNDALAKLLSAQNSLLTGENIGNIAPSDEALER